MKTLRGKVVALTGAASGIGRCLAVELAGQGAHLALADVNEEGLLNTLKMIEDRGVKVTTHLVDVADRARVFEYAEEAAAAHGGVDVIINNAGVAIGNDIENASFEDLEWVINVNLWGVIHGTKAFLPHLRRRPWGHIVNVSSINGIVPFPNNGPYNIAKYGVRGLNETLMQELRKDNVRVSSVHPGGIQTNIVRNMRFTEFVSDEMNHNQMAAMFQAIALTTAEDAARIIVRGVRKNKKRIMVGIDSRVMEFFSRLVPITNVVVTGMVTELLVLPRTRAIIDRVAGLRDKIKGKDKEEKNG